MGRRFDPDRAHPYSRTTKQGIHLRYSWKVQIRKSSFIWLLVSLLPFVMTPTLSLDPFSPAKTIFMGGAIALVCYIYRKSVFPISSLLTKFYFLIFVFVILFIFRRQDANFSRFLFGNFGRGFGFISFFLGALIFLLAFLLGKSHFQKTEKLSFFHTLLSINILQLVIFVLQEKFVSLQFWDTAQQPVPVTTLGNPNYVAAIIGITCVSCIHWLFVTKKRPNQVASILIILINIFVLTQVKSLQGFLFCGVLSLFILVQVLHAKMNQNASKRRFNFIIFLVLGLCSVVTIFMLRSEILGSTFSARVNYWRQALQGVINSPFVGNGFGEFGDQQGNLSRHLNIVDSGYSDSPHNLFLEVAFSVGLIPASIMLFVIVQIFKNVRRFWNSIPENEIWLLFVIWIGLILQSWISPVELSMFFTLCGITGVLYSYLSHRDIAMKQTKKMNVLAIIVELLRNYSCKKRIFELLNWTVNLFILGLLTISIYLATLNFMVDSNFRRSIEVGDGMKLFQLSNTFPVDASRYSFTFDVLYQNGEFTLARKLLIQFSEEFPRHPQLRTFWAQIKPK